MLIYRIENQEGIGIFRSGYEFNCEMELCKKHSTYPVPQYDTELGFIDKEEFCAFNTIDDLLLYFEFEWFLEFLSAGFSVYEIEVDRTKVRQSYYQTLFKKEHIIHKKNLINV